MTAKAGAFQKVGAEREWMVEKMADRCPTNVYYEFHGMGAEVCPYPCQNKTEYGYCKTTGCINPKFDRTRTFTWYDPIEIARQYAPKFDKPVVDMVEVVRCKDCKYWRYNDCKNDTHGYCPINENDFCSQGERKDEVEE